MAEPIPGKTPDSAAQLAPAPDQIVPLEAKIAANGYSVVTQQVNFLHHSWGTDVDVYGYNEDDLPKVPGVYLYDITLDQAPVGTEPMTQRVLLYDPDRVRVLNSRGEVGYDTDHIRRVAQRGHYATLVDDDRWGLIAVKTREPQITEDLTPEEEADRELDQDLE